MFPWKHSKATTYIYYQKFNQQDYQYYFFIYICFEAKINVTLILFKSVSIHTGLGLSRCIGSTSFTCYK